MGDHMIVDPRNGYMQPEDEWEREAMLDPAWERQQRKTFTAWCNSHLRKAGAQIENIEEDFRNGLKLLMLLEVISGESLQRPDKGKMRFHKIANVNKVLEFIQRKGVRLMVGAEEIVDGNLKMTLGMIWTIILRFAIQDISIEEISAKEGLLLWCQRKTACYKNVNVQNFHTSFKDGLAFCALIHRHRPDLLDFNLLSKENSLDNLTTAFNAAEKHLDIPKMLDANEIEVSVRPDEKSIMTYVSSYYHAFAGAQKVEQAANRICKVLSLNQDTDNLIDSYIKYCSELLIWISQKLEDLNAASQPCDGLLSTSHSKLTDFRTYKTREKPDRMCHKSRVENDYRSIQMKMRLKNKPSFVPPEGMLLKDIDDAWRKLEEAEKAHEDWLIKELRRLQRLDYLIKKFNVKCAAHEEWTKGKDKFFVDSRVDGRRSSLHDIKALRKKHEAFESELSAHQNRVEQIKKIAGELAILEHPTIDEVDERCDKICSEWNRLGDETQANALSLLEKEKYLEKVDTLYLEFAKRASPFVSWLDGAREDLQDTLFVQSLDEIKSLMDAHEVFKGTLDEADMEHGELVRLHEEVQLFASSYNLSDTVDPYTNVHAKRITEKWNKIKELVPQRDGALEQELKKQEAHEHIRLQFAEKASSIGSWLDTMKEQVVHTSSHSYSTRTLEGQLNKLNDLRQKTMDHQHHINELENFNHEQQKAIIFENSHTVYTMDGIRISYRELCRTIQELINEIEAQIVIRDSKGIREDQLSDFRNAFGHFDKEKSGNIETNDFRSCLIALGYNIKDDSQGDKEFTEIMETVDPSNIGLVSFDAFLDFMTKELSGEDTVEQLIHSFRILSAGKPYITKEQLEQELPPSQAEYCLKLMQPFHQESDDGDDGNIPPDGSLDFAGFVSALLGETDV